MSSDSWSPGLFFPGTGDAEPAGWSCLRCGVFVARLPAEARLPSSKGVHDQWHAGLEAQR